VCSRELQGAIDGGARTPARGVHGQAARQLDELGFRGFKQFRGCESFAEVVDRKPNARVAI
jgi:hypothetical protein